MRILIQSSTLIEHNFLVCKFGHLKGQFFLISKVDLYESKLGFFVSEKTVLYKSSAL